MAARGRSQRDNELSAFAPFLLLGGGAVVAALLLSKKPKPVPPATPPPPIPANSATVLSSWDSGLASGGYDATKNIPQGSDDRAFEMMLECPSGDLRFGLLGLWSYDTLHVPSNDIGYTTRGRVLTVGNVDMTLPVELFDGQPHLLVLSFSGSTLVWTCYVDGAAVGTFTDGGSQVGAAGTVAIGYTPEESSAVGCSFENVSIYRHQLTAARVAAHWAARTNQNNYVAAVLTDSPASFWQLNDPVGSATVQDSLNNLDLPVGAAQLGQPALFAL